MSTQKPKHFILDFETLGSTPDAIVLELSAIVFDPYIDEPYESLVDKAFNIKFNVKAQKASGKRVSSPGAIEFWKKQPKELQEKMLLPTDADVTIEEGVKLFETYLQENNIQPWKSIGWCRGQSFDFPILVDMLRAVYLVDDTFEFEPIKFWNQRDIRSFVAGAVGDYDKTNIPISVDEATGFVHHDSVHDCAKDILMIRKAYKIANGIELDFPEKAEYLEATLK